VIGVVKRAWIPLVIRVVVVVGGFVAYRMHGAFASHAVTTAGQGAVTERTNSALSRLLAGLLRTLARRRCTMCSTSRPRLPTPANSTGFQELLK
jgi:hypothetical protein